MVAAIHEYANDGLMGSCKYHIKEDGIMGLKPLIDSPCHEFGCSR
jgi:hypothetical protein